MDQQRRERFVAWFEATYKGAADARQRFMEESGKHGYAPLTKGRVSQLFDLRQRFGEAAAKNIAIRLGLPESTFLVDDTASVADLRLPPDILHMAINLATVEDAKARAAIVAMAATMTDIELDRQKDRQAAAAAQLAHAPKRLRARGR
jgi:hypothetical protein